MTTNDEILQTEPIWRATLDAGDSAMLASGRGQIVHSRPDVLIVGGGVIGLCIAYYLAEQGTVVQLIDAGELGAGASGANAGGIWPNDQGPAHPADFQELAFLSRDLWGRLAVRPGFDFDWRVNGFLCVNSDRIGPAPAVTAARLQEQGYAVQAVDAEQIERLEPHLRRGISFGLHAPSDAHVHPLKAVASLTRAARAKGAGISPGVAVVSIVADDRRIRQVETTAGPIAAAHVVAATGWSATWLKPALNELPRLRPVGGQLLATAPLPRLLNSAVGGRFLLLQLPTGEIVTGGNLVESASVVPDRAVNEQFAAAARELLPALGDVPFVRTWCGIRAGTPDGLPIIDRAGEIANLWLACGHFRNGVLMAPGTGKLLADWISSGKQPGALTPFGARRFGA